MTDRIDSDLSEIRTTLQALHSRCARFDAEIDMLDKRVGKGHKLNWGALAAVGTTLLSVLIYYGDMKDRPGIEQDTQQNQKLLKLQEDFNVHAQAGGHVGALLTQENLRREFESEISALRREIDIRFGTHGDLPSDPEHGHDHAEDH